jgi:hypothetical protein
MTGSDRAEDEVVLRPSRSELSWLLLGSCGFVALGWWLASEHWLGWICVGFFGLGIPIALVQLVPGGSYLRLGPDRFEWRSLFRTHSVRWADVERFRVVETGASPVQMVVFDAVAGFDRSRLGQRLSTAVNRCDGWLPDTYGETADALADHLNHRVALARGRLPTD